MPKDFAAWASRWRVPLAFVLVVAFLFLAQPRLVELLSGAALALVGLLLRAWSAGHLAKNQRLITSGPYAYTRNPLYLGSALMGLGAALAGCSWIMGLAFVAFFCLIYWPVMGREARGLQQLFGEAFAAYARQVPLFLPRRPRAPRGREKFQWSLYLKNREYEAAIGYAAIMFFVALKMWLR
jgi:protein-S-isoprenylcysteine O-methyltransferase Ste14